MRKLLLLFIICFHSMAWADAGFIGTIANDTQSATSAKGNYAIKVTDTSATGDAINLYWDQGSATTTWYAIGYFYIQDLGTESTDQMRLMRLDLTQGSSDCFTVIIDTDPGPTYNIKSTHRNSVASTITSSLTAITPPCWIGVRFKWIANQGSNGVSFELDTDVNGTFETTPTISDTSTYNRNGQYLSAPWTSQDIDDQQTIYSDMIKVSNSSMPTINLSSVWSCADANILCENFEDEADGYDTASGWTEVTTDGTITVKSSHPVGLP